MTGQANGGGGAGSSAVLQNGVAQVLGGWEDWQVQPGRSQVGTQCAATEVCGKRTILNPECCQGRVQLCRL